jgi:ADP-ribose pyrophosphatase YjhB (NUDIX family)
VTKVRKDRKSLQKVIIRSRCIIVDDDGRILMQREKNGTYSIPGGRLEFDETLPFCASRELKEEAGIEAIPIRLLYIVETINTRKGYPRHEIMFYFLCDHKGAPRKEFKEIRFEWKRPEDVADGFWPPEILEKLIEDSPDFNNTYFMVIVDRELKFVNTIRKIVHEH